MMLSKFQFHHNAIITGHMDSFCLVCESHLKCDKDIHTHIDKPVHQKNLDAAPYFEKFKDELVRKAKRGYFCEICNLPIATAAKIGLHVVEPLHINNKGLQSLRRIGNAIGALKDIYIDERAWHGLIEDTCALCNEDFMNEQLHKTQASHMLNLVQIKIEFGVSDAIYRRMDDTTFQCLTCNQMFSMDPLKSHFTSQDHLNSLAQCRKTMSLDTGLSGGQENGNQAAKKPKPTSKSQTKTKTRPKYKSTTSSQTESKITTKTQAGTSDLDDSVSCKKNTKIKEIQSDEGDEKNLDTNSTKEIKSLKSNECHFLEAANTKLNAESHVKEGTQKKDNVFSGVLSPNKGTENQSKDTTPEKKDKNIPENIKSITKELHKDLILENVADLQKNWIDINFETEIVFCKKCVAKLSLDYQEINKHILEHADQPKNSDITTPILDQKNRKMVLKNTELDQKLDQNHNIRKHEVVDLTSGNVGPNSELVPYIPIASHEAEIQTEAKGEFPETDDPVLYAKQHHLTYNKGNFDAYCRVCQVKLPSTLKSMKEHVEGKKHRKILQIHEQNMLAANRSISRKPFKHFITSVTEIGGGGVKEMVVNDQFCMSWYSFFMVTTHLGWYRCQACEVRLREADVEDHVESSQHRHAMALVPVVLNLSNEFVREVRPGLFHCSYCHLIAGDFKDLHRHLVCDDHRHLKTIAISRLLDYMPLLVENRRRQHDMYRIMFLASMGFGHGMV